jgi:hypothetical protein
MPDDASGPSSHSQPSRVKFHSTCAFLLLGAVVSCVDMNVQNPNAPDAARAFTAENVAATVGGAYTTWLGTQGYSSSTALLSVAAGQHNTPWSCCGTEYFSRFPRQGTQNEPGNADTWNVVYAWYEAYQAIAALHAALKQLDDGVVDLGPEGNLRARAFGRFVQGLAHGTVALLYDSGYVYDETMDPAGAVLQGYPSVMQAALGYLGDAIALAESGTFTVPAAWMSREVSSHTLAQLARSWRARLRANVARTPAARRAVAWESVVADAAAGIDQDWTLDSQCWHQGLVGIDERFCEDGLLYMLLPGWQSQDNWIMGMADQSGAYQAWLHTPLHLRRPFLIATPDTRWPQGTNEAAQLANAGAYYTVGRTDDQTRIWQRPDRGTWRWSYYYQTKEPYYSFAVTGYGELPQITVREMRALAAEAAYYRGDLGAVASFVNETRPLHGLRATDATGANTDCVPRLPSGVCGGLWEMFKWEKRLETQFAGPLHAGWYFDSRGWGDLIQGTVLEFPVPYGELEILQRPWYDYGGVGKPGGAEPSSYGFEAYLTW